MSKTISVKYVVNKANRMLALDTISANEKKGICHLVESVLHEINNYSGFNYNFWVAIGYEKWTHSEKDENKKDEFIFLKIGIDMH